MVVGTVAGHLRHPQQFPANLQEVPTEPRSAAEKAQHQLKPSKMHSMKENFLEHPQEGGSMFMKEKFSGCKGGEKGRVPPRGHAARHPRFDEDSSIVNRALALPP